MVAIKSLFVNIVAIGAVVALSAQEIKPRIAGLENNKEYMSLLAADSRLRERADSLAGAIITLREKFIDDSERRKELSAEILRLESESFSVQGERNRLLAKINAVEQEWLVVNMNNRPAPKSVQPEEEVAVPIDTRKYADLTRNGYFATLSSSEDYKMLRRAQRYETTAVELLAQFEERYSSMSKLRDDYLATDSEGSADSLMTLFLNRRSECGAIADSLASTWSFIFDNKTYMYDLLFDKEGRHDMLQRAETNLLTMRQNIDRERGVYLADALVDYTFQKRCVVDYEIDVANALGLHSAADSLSRVKAKLSSLRYDFEPIEIKRRYFLDYQPMEFPSGKYIYTSNNPMPECKIYENGEMYRIKLGEFAERQPLSKFRGLEHVYYLHPEDGGWIYYAGAYPSVEDMEKHLITVRKLGFRSADVVAWIDGTYAGSRAAIEELKRKSFSIEISGTEVLSESVRRIIVQLSEGSELSRVSKKSYLVSGFRSREAAEVVVRGIVSADSSLKVGVAEVR